METAYVSGFKARTDTEQRELHHKYNALPNKTSKTQFVKENATRWSELVRLPYFDMCRMIVIDPMHNLFLGMSISVVRYIFYMSGFQELSRPISTIFGSSFISFVRRKSCIASMLYWEMYVSDLGSRHRNLTTLFQLKMPAKLGRLPGLIGEPAGGSLTADQWLIFATVVAPLAVCHLFLGELHIELNLHRFLRFGMTTSQTNQT
jgi:hypothetical protein